MRLLFVILFLALAPGAAIGAEPRSAHAFRFDGLMGGQVDLADYRGRVVLLVNTASECGYTPQLAGLQRLYAARARDGLVVIGAPSNDFGGQEPLSGKALNDFCALNFGVAFPMTAPIAVRGPSAHPFYRWARQAFGPAGEPRWNFHKLLIGKDGQPIAAFPSRVEPGDPALAAAIDRALR